MRNKFVLILMCLFGFSNIALAEKKPTPGKIVPLFDARTRLEPAIRIETPTALITRVADRVRDRHAREPGAYDHYLSWYWEERTVTIELIDRVAKGGKDIQVNITSLAPLNNPDFRCFFRGVNTVAEYHHNVATKPSGKNRYQTTISYNSSEQRELRVGDRMEFEFSPFLADPAHGRSNYYGTAMLYVIGKGIVPWHGVGDRLDSTSLPATALLGGGTTLPGQYSSEPARRFQQMATNISPASGQPFVLGRRLHHTDFSSGQHSEQPNPVYEQQAGKLGPGYVATSCIACHRNNGRALPPEPGKLMNKTVIQVAAARDSSPHPQLGRTVQSQSVDGAAETVPVIADWTTESGLYGDGTPFRLRRPTYRFTAVQPTYYSVRLAPQLVGLGLLEAVDEATLLALADPEDRDQDGVSGRVQIVKDPETDQFRLGRFGYKAGKARLRHQIAAALNNDMGVTTTVFPRLDGESRGSNVELDDKDLSHLTRYVATLGVVARRGIDNPQVQQGEVLFGEAGCVKCHRPALVTGSYHPLAELREQKIQPFTDLLLHDMGAGLADNLGESLATGAEWRTAPLWGIGLTREISGAEAYLHDGRAQTLEEAILWHGGEGKASREAFRTMSATDREALIQFVRSL